MTTMATYRQVRYYVISHMDGIFELAPTPHGAGSFYVPEVYVTVESA